MIIALSRPLMYYYILPMLPVIVPEEDCLEVSSPLCVVIVVEKATESVPPPVGAVDGNTRAH